MANFAVIENGKVINKIIADSAADAETVTGKTCVEYTDDNPAYIGLGYNSGIFEQPTPDEVVDVSGDEVILLDHVIAETPIE